MNAAELRPYLVALDKSLTDLERDVCESAAAQTETANTLEQLTELVRTLVGKVGDMHDQIDQMDRRLGQYISDAAKERSGVRDVDKRLRVVENKLGA